MTQRTVTLPEVGLIAGTRAALGMGIGLLIADRLSNDQRKAAGWALFAFGAITTFPLLAEILKTRPAPEDNGHHEFHPRLQGEREKSPSQE